MRTSLVILVFSSFVAAQSVSPVHFTAVEATSNNTYPFGGSLTTGTPFRYAQVHDDVPAMVIQGIAFRYNASTSTTLYQAHTLTLDVWMSTAAAGVTAQTPQATFDNNHGADKLQVVTNRTINVPGSDPSLLPGAFLLDIPFDLGVLFPYAAGGSSLVWEVHVTARTNTQSIPYDAVSTLNNNPTNPPLAASKAFTGCIATGKTSPMTVTPGTSPMDWPNSTGSLVVNASQLENNGLVVWVLGLDRTQWAGVPLPFDVPGSSGAPSGTCTLHTDLGLLTPATASATGTAQLSLSFPLNPAMHGATINTQVLGIDLPANPLGFTLSNLAIQQICAPYATPLPGCRIYLPGSLGPTGTTGTTTHLVTRFY